MFRTCSVFVIALLKLEKGLCKLDVSSLDLGSEREGSSLAQKVLDPVPVHYELDLLLDPP